MSLLWPLGSVAAVGCGTYAFFHGFRALRIQRLIMDTPTAKVRSLAMGLVEVEGKVQARSRVTAPFTNRSCAWWQVELQTLSQSNKGLKQWNTVYKEQSGNPFYLADGTGTDAVGAAHVRTLDGECCAVIRRGKTDAAFIISERSEKTMSMEFGFKAVGGLVGGPALTLFGVWCLIELAKSGDLPLPH